MYKSNQVSEPREPANKRVLLWPPLQFLPPGSGLEFPALTSLELLLVSIYHSSRNADQRCFLPSKSGKWVNNVLAMHRDGPLRLLLSRASCQASWMTRGGLNAARPEAYTEKPHSGQT